MTRQEIIDHIKEKRSFLCVGLDSDIKKMPQWLVEEADGDTYKAMMAFNKAIIDATAPYCVAYKPNTAFYEAFGADGWKALADTIAYIKEKHPRHFVIADAKRGDIGNTSAMYARAFFNDLQADAITVAPYMGEDSVKPFIGYEGKWVILLATKEALISSSYATRMETAFLRMSSANHRRGARPTIRCMS